jgi:hypothetical protein
MRALAGRGFDASYLSPHVRDLPSSTLLGLAVGLCFVDPVDSKSDLTAKDIKRAVR